MNTISSRKHNLSGYVHCMCTKECPAGTNQILMIKIISVFFIQLGTSDEEGIENFNELINIIKEYFDDVEKK